MFGELEIVFVKVMKCGCLYHSCSSCLRSVQDLFIDTDIRSSMIWNNALFISGTSHSYSIGLDFGKVS